MAILAIGFSFPQAFATSIDNVMAIVKDIQAKVNSSVFGLSAIKTAVDTPASYAASLKNKGSLLIGHDILIGGLLLF